MNRTGSEKGLLKRARVTAAAFVLLFLYLAARILLLQTVDYEKYEKLVIGQMTTESTVKADRGRIYDADGIVIATNITTYRVFISPSAIARDSQADGKDYASQIADGMAQILGVDREEILKQTTYTNKLDRTLAREVKEEVAQKVWSYVKENNFGDMVFTEATSTRYYPYVTLASHLLGTVGSGYGLEAQYNRYLAGEDGRYITARDSTGKEMPFEYDSYIAATDGADVTSTIRLYVQAALEEELEATYTESGGENRACGIVMDVNTGAIIAMAVYPSFDLNQPRVLDPQSLRELAESGFEEGSKEYTDKQTELIMSMWSNKNITEPYMPGSTFKVMTAAMAYEENLVRENEHFNCPGYYVVNGRKIRCHKIQGHGSLTFAGGIQQSCNPVLMQMGLRIGADKFYNYFRSFGYRQKTGIDLPGEVDASSLFWNRETFASADIYLATAAFGQNFKVTALQQITAIASVANGGYLVTPHVVDRITDKNGNVLYEFDGGTRRQAISKETCETVSRILEEGVSGNGGAKNAYVAGYRVAAKTGTSEKKDEGDGKYVCSCVAFAPADNARYAAIILVDEPTKGTLYGSVVAAPYIQHLMETILPYLGVEAEYTDEELEKMAVETPSLLYWGTSVAKSFGESMGFTVEVVGEGSVVKAQSPAPGSKVESGTAKIILYTDAKADKKTVTVPNLIGKTAVAANQTLAMRNLNIRIQGTKNYLSGSGATVVAQEPAAGTEVEAGSVITVTFRYTDLTDD